MFKIEKRRLSRSEYMLHVCGGKTGIYLYGSLKRLEMDEILKNLKEADYHAKHPIRRKQLKTLVNNLKSNKYV